MERAVRVAGVVLTSIGGVGVVGSYFYSVFARPALWVVLGVTVVVIVGMLLLLLDRLLRRRVAESDAQSASAEQLSLFQVLVGALLLLAGAVVVIAFFVNPSGGGTAVFALVLGVLAFLGGLLALLAKARRARP